MKLAQSIVVLAVLAVTVYGGINLFLRAAIREQEFRDNIRAARCELVEYQQLKGYCYE